MSLICGVRRVVCVTELTWNKCRGDAQDAIMTLAPKKANWDLKRDVAKKLEKLERRTQVSAFRHLPLSTLSASVLQRRAHLQNCLLCVESHGGPRRRKP